MKESVYMYHIFISHAWKYNEDYNKVVSWLNEAQKDGILTWSNYSVPSHDPLIDPNTIVGKNRLKALIDNQIRPASKILVLSGMYSAYSDWIEYEVKKSVELKKYIIGIKPWGQERIPMIIQNNSNTIVGWNKSSVISAIINS